MSFRNIVFSAGAMSGLSFVGAWRALEELSLTTDIVGFSGCSIGSIMAFLVSIGYTGDELQDLAYSLKYKDLSDFQILYALDNLGLDTGNKIVHLLEELLERKTGSRKMTFLEHFQITGRELWINAACVEHDKCYYYSMKNSPDMDILVAVRMSISLPWIMAAVRYNGLTYIDGGFHDPCPVHMFPSDQTLVLRTKNILRIDPNEHEFIRHTSTILFSAYQRLHSHLKDMMSEYNVIWIDTGLSAIALDVSRKQRKRLVLIGYNTLKTWSEQRAQGSEQQAQGSEI